MRYEEKKIGKRNAVLCAYLLDGRIAGDSVKQWPCVIVIPGGGYLLPSTREGESVAVRFLGEGYSAFVLRYSTKVKNRATREWNEDFAYPEPSVELLEAIHIIRENAAEWNLDPNRIYIAAFSAGAHIALSALCRAEEDSIQTKLSFPLNSRELNLRGMILGYPMVNVHTMDPIIQSAILNQKEWTAEDLKPLDMSLYLNKLNCGLFVWQTGEDTMVRPEDVCRFVTSAIEQHIPVEYHLFEKGPHGLALADESHAKPEEPLYPEVESWFAMAVRWMKNHN